MRGAAVLAARCCTQKAGARVLGPRRPLPPYRCRFRFRCRCRYCHCCCRCHCPIQSQRTSRHSHCCCCFRRKHSPCVATASPSPFRPGSCKSPRFSKMPSSRSEAAPTSHAQRPRAQARVSLVPWRPFSYARRPRRPRPRRRLRQHRRASPSAPAPSASSSASPAGAPSSFAPLCLQPRPG